MGELTYRPYGRVGIAEVAPTHCLAGHPLTAGQVLVGGDVTCRTYTCLMCKDSGSTPHTMRYLPPATPGREPEVTHPAPPPPHQPAPETPG